MPFRNLLIQLWSYPIRTPDNVLSAALGISKMLGARVTAAICKADRPSASRELGLVLSDVWAVSAAAERDGVNSAKEIEDFLKEANIGQYHPIDIVNYECDAAAVPRELVGRARLSDLVVVPLQQNEATLNLTQDLILASGRPVLLLPDDVPCEISLGVVVVAWDGSKVAARAISDALPILKFAQVVKLVEIAGDQPLDGSSSTEAVGEWLLVHDIKAETETIFVDGASESAALARYCNSHHADLLVMGAYGHTSMKDFIKGGVTGYFLAEMPLPMLLSH